MCEKMIRRLIYFNIGLLMIYTLQWYFEMLCPSLIISKEAASINVRKLNHMGRGRGTTLGEKSHLKKTHPRNVHLYKTHPAHLEVRFLQVILPV